MHSIDCSNPEPQFTDTETCEMFKYKVFAILIAAFALHRRLQLAAAFMTPHVDDFEKEDPDLTIID